jgi:hypothetical protein
MNAAARWISVLGHPFVTSLVLVTAVALRLSTPGDAIKSLLLVALIAIVPIILLIRRQVRAGAWTTVDASRRSERPILFLVGLLALAGLLVAAYAARSASFLTRGAIGVMAMLATCAIATKWIKLSLHMAFAALAATTLLLLRSPAGWALLCALPFLGWSRLALKRHSLLEVVLGSLAGVVFGYAIYRL